MRSDSKLAPRGVLPAGLGLDVGALARLFDDATNAYKHLFFGALLARLRGLACG
jgi:hypothetical protein